MKYYKQEHLYTPGDKAPKGSCYPTVLACMLDIGLHDVPYFHLFCWSKEERDNFTKAITQRYCNGNYDTAEEHEKDNFRHHTSRFLNLWWDVCETWLYSQGYKITKILNENFEEWLKNNPDTPYLVSGKSSRGVDHIVIYMNGQLHHDPHPSDEGLKTLWDEPYEILEKIV